MAKKPVKKTTKNPGKKAVSKTQAKAKPAVKTAAKKPAVKKPAAKKAAPKKSAVKKPAVKKTPAKKVPAKAASKKVAPKTATAKKAPPKKVAPKTATAKKVTPKKVIPKTAAAKKSTAKKATPKKSTPKKSTKKPAAQIPQHPARVPLADPGPAEVLGRITWLMLQSEQHKHLFLTDLEWRVLPPVLLKQFRLFRKDGAPIGYAAWALVDENTDQRLRKGETKLKPEDWRSGPNLWLLDLIAPFGGDKMMLKELGEKVFKGKAFRTFMPGKDGKGLRVVEIGPKQTGKKK